MDAGSEKKQLRHVMEKFQTLRDKFESQEAVTFKNGSSRFLVVFFCPWFLNGQEFDDLVMVRDDWVRPPKHLITFLDFVSRPKKFSLEDQHLNVVRIFLRSQIKFFKSKLLVWGSNVGKSFEVDKFYIFTFECGHEIERIIAEREVPSEDGMSPPQKQV